MSFAVACVLLLCALANVRANLHFMSDEFINELNRNQSSWRAGRNFPEDTPLEHIKMLCGALRSPDLHLIERRTHDPTVRASLPDTFDAREKWPECPSLKEIRDQGCCGSCWAFGATEAITDRICIFSKGAIHFHVSAEDLISCSLAGNCSGGYPEYAWTYFQDEGLVSGGNYGTHDGCYPYEISPKCKQPHVYEPTPECRPVCEKGYGKSYRDDKMYSKSVYTIGENEEDIRAEIYQYGPVETAFSVYEDFSNYKNGVYVHTHGEYLGGHAVKLLGWGEDGGKKYWLVANSWGPGWGDHGCFKILRGENHCGIEDYIVAGEPKF